MEKITDDELNTIMISTILMEENPEYMNETIYEFETENKTHQITRCDNIFEDVSPQYICLKLVHNISMMGSFLKNYISQTGAKCNSYSSIEKKLYVKFLITAEKIDIIKKKGFGFLVYNVDDFAYCLWGFNEALNSYLKIKSQEKEYNYLNIILKDWFEYSFKAPDTAMSTFISNNKDFYKKEFEKVKKIEQEDQIEN